MRDMGTKGIELSISIVHLTTRLYGVIIPDEVGVVNGSSPAYYELKVPGAIEEYVNVGAAWICKN